MSKWPHQNQVDDFYGNPRGKDGEVSPNWVTQNIVKIPAPWKLITAWDSQPVSGIRIHKKCSESLTIVLAEIWQASGENEKKIKEWGMHLYAGGFNFRLMKGKTRLSMHSWGCAVDFDSARNGYGDNTPNFKDIPEVVAAFEREQWAWGGRWHNTVDGMHFQAAHL
jgi:hypothetical protein